MTDHTPGPWKVGNGDIYADGNKSSDFDDRVICAIGQSGGFRSHEYAVIKAHKPEGKANARLIAAAPELLSLAFQYRDDLRHLPSPDSALRRRAMVEAVIAKALGTTNEPPPCNHDWQPSPHHPNAEFCTKCEARRGWSVPVSELGK